MLAGYNVLLKAPSARLSKSLDSRVPYSQQNKTSMSVVRERSILMGSEVPSPVGSKIPVSFTPVGSEGLTSRPDPTDPRKNVSASDNDNDIHYNAQRPISINY